MSDGCGPGIEVAGAIVDAGKIEASGDSKGDLIGSGVVKHAAMPNDNATKAINRFIDRSAIL